MDHCAFIGLEDISDGLPSYREEVVPVAMAEPLKTAYEELEEEITACLKEHRGNSSVASTMLNALLAWPDHPYGFGTLYGSEFNLETKCRESFVIAETVDLDKNETYAKERALIEEVKAQLRRDRKCQVYAVYTLTRGHDPNLRCPAVGGLAKLEGLSPSDCPTPTNLFPESCTVREHGWINSLGAVRSPYRSCAPVHPPAGACGGGAAYGHLR